MANRSYLYTVDKPPTRKGKASKPRGVAEFGWDIPLSHKILVHANAKVCPSAIWKKNIGIVGDREAGVDLLLQFLEVLADGKAKNAKELKSAISETKKFFSDKKRKQKLFLLEAGEIFDMAGTDLEVQAKALVQKDIPATVKRVRKAIDGAEKKWLATLRKNCSSDDKPTLGEGVGISYWSDVLYFDFT